MTWEQILVLVVFVPLLIVSIYGFIKNLNKVFDVSKPK